MDRVVRVGTHTGENKLPARMVQHYQIETKDRSIFRKNIGRIYLNQVNDPYIDIWNVSNTERKNRLANLPYRDRKSTRLNSSHVASSYAVFRLKRKSRTS